MSLNFDRDCCVGRFFGLPHAPCLKTIPVGSAQFAVTKIFQSFAEETVVTIPPTDAYFLMLYLRAAVHADIQHDGSRTSPRNYPAGSVCLVDLSPGASIALQSELTSLAFLLPRQLLNEIAEMASGDVSSRPRIRRGEIDPTIENLGVALLPFFEEQQDSRQPVLKHIAVAICAHLLHEPRHILSGGGDDGCATPIPVEGDVPVRFSQAANCVTMDQPGMLPEAQRVEKAKLLLRDCILAICDVADLCGFLDEDDLIQAFVREAGMTPASYRKLLIQ